jgi:hypothetical protein
LEEAARLLTLRYAVPLALTQDENNNEKTIERLADWAYQYIVEYIARHFKQGTQTKLDIASIVDSVFQANTVERKDTELVIQFESPVEITNVPKVLLPPQKYKKNGNQAGFFTRCGIATLNGELYHGANADSIERLTPDSSPETISKPEITRKNSITNLFAKTEVKAALKCDQPNVYGYRLGTREEAEKLGLTQVYIEDDQRDQVTSFFNAIMSTGAYTSLDEAFSSLKKQLELIAEEFKRIQQPVEAEEQ